MRSFAFLVRSSLVLTLLVAYCAAVSAQTSPLRGSLVEDRAARKLLEAGDARLESDETKKAVEVWQSVIERYPRSRVRFEAHMRLGNFFLERDRAYDRARVQFESVITEENRDEEQRAKATLKMGRCFYEARNFGKAFQVMRDVIEKYPVSSQVNEAYYYIGLGHFQLGHYSRAIAALEKVGTALSADDGQFEKVEAGKRLFVKIEDADLAALETGEELVVQCKCDSGDVEMLKCYSVGRNVRIVLGSIPTRLGRPVPKNGILEVRGHDQVNVTYTDSHTADKQFDKPVDKKVVVVGDGVVTITDGAFSETLRGVVLGKSANIQIIDADGDLTDEGDAIKAVAEVYRAKTEEEIEKELIEAATSTDDSESTIDVEDEEPEVDRFKKVDQVAINLTEAVIETKVSEIVQADESEEPAKEKTPETPDADKKAEETKAPPEGESSESGEAGPETADPVVVEEDSSIHSGVFRTNVMVSKADEIIADDDILQALPGDFIRVTYIDDRNTTEGVKQVTFEARCIEGNLGGVRVTRSVISDQELRVRTKLKTANALTNIGNRYKEFGLKKNADAKYAQALQVSEEITTEARKLGGRLLEETYVQLWQIYFEMDRLELAAAMAQRLQREFPNSGFVDDALLQLADVARKQGNTQRAIGIYNRLVNMDGSQLRGEAQFGIAECYQSMADATTAQQATQLYDRAFQEYKKVFENFPDSGRVGDAVSRMANYYYRQKDYARAIDTFETVLANYPDAKFLDVILFNYGRCLYRMKRPREARQRFDQLISDYPESTLAPDAKKISDALAKAGI